MATRPGFPKDKSSVENQVLITYRRVYALIRNTTFHSRTELNNAILQKLEEHHRQNFQKKTYSRYQLFNSEEKPLLQPLPQTPYELRHYTRGKVHKNYYVVVGEDWHFYSVPSTYVGKEVQIVYDSDCVEIYHRQERIALHKRSFKKHAYTTEWEHMPENHKRVAEPQRRTAKRMESGILPQKGLRKWCLYPGVF